VQDVTAAEFGCELVAGEDAFVDRPSRAVFQHAFLPALERVARTGDRRHDDELACDPASLGEEARALGLLEVAVEVAGEHAVELAVLERQRESVTGDEPRGGHLLARDVEHPLALVEADDVAAEMARQEAGAAGDIERSCGWEPGDQLGEDGDLVVPSGADAIGVETPPEPPVVVLVRAPIVVRLHGGSYSSGVPLPLESVPNFSEGRDRGTIDALAAALGGPAELLDVHSDPDHNRSVFTLVGDEDELVAALVAGVACARERIDLRRHEGAHPRIGAADVVPVVAVDPVDSERARGCALLVAEGIGAELELPVFLYGDSAPGRGPAFFRHGGPEELQQRIDAGELSPDFGPARLDERAGGVIVGARRPLIAFNVNLTTQDVDVAREIAAVVRERDGGFPGVRALGLSLPRAGHAQVSMNVEDYEAAALHDIVARVESEALARGVEVSGAELVGLLPAGAAVAAAGGMLRIDGFSPEHVLELRLLRRH
jgi:glutamate formiminotransferase / 5-formyltetrahydrofolate cyclo-ligase